MKQGDGRAKLTLGSNGERRAEDKKIRPIRRESWPLRSVFKENDFSYVDDIARERKSTNIGRKGFRGSALFSALLFMYLRGIDSILSLVRFLDKHPEWVRFLGLRRGTRDGIAYVVPDRTTFNHFVKRLGPELIAEILVRATIQLMGKEIIRGRSISLDCTTIWAWFKDGKGKKRKSRDRDAGWTYDSYREMYVYGYKIHILLDVDTGLPIGIKVTRANYGENRTLIPFVDLIAHRYPIDVENFLADAAYDGNKSRLRIINRLEAVPYIKLNPRNCKGKNEKEKMARRKKLCERFYRKNFVHSYWIDPDDHDFVQTFKARTFSEQGFSISKGALALDIYRHRGIVWATMHAVLVCVGMLAVANTAVIVGRPELKRCIKCFVN